MERSGAACRSSGTLCACSTARSFSGWAPVMLALASVPSAKVTLTRSAPRTTCRLVRMTPVSTITTPVPVLRSTSLPRLVVVKPITRTTDGATASAARAAAEGRVWFSSVCSTAASMAFCVMCGAGAGRSHHIPPASSTASSAMAAHCACCADGRRRRGAAGAGSGGGLSGAAGSADGRARSLREGL